MRSKKTTDGKKGIKLVKKNRKLPSVNQLYFHYFKKFKYGIQKITQNQISIIPNSDNISK